MKDRSEKKSIFLKTFGETPKLKVLDFLMENSMFDWKITDITDGSNVSYNTLKTFLPEFVNRGIIKKTRRVGKSDYYQINKDHPFIKILMKVTWDLIESDILKGKRVMA